MKILMLNYEFPPLGGGAGNATKYLLEEFSRRNDLNIVLITSSVDNFRAEDFSPNIRIYYLDIHKQGNLHYQSLSDLVKYSWQAYWFSKKLMRQENFDLIHAFFGIPNGYLAMKLGLPYLVSLRGSDVPFYNQRFNLLDKLFFKHLSRKVWSRAKKVVANSSDLRELALQTSPQQEIEIVGNGVDINKFFPGEKNNNLFTILSTSRLTPRKGIRTLLKAFIDFFKEHQDSQLLIAGRGEEEDDLKKLALNSSAKNNIKFLRVIEHEKLPELYRQADVFCLPSLNEGMSNSLLEALASGLAIIATDTGGARDLVTDNGRIVKTGNSQEIFASLEKMYLNKELLKQMKSNSRRRSEQLGWLQIADKYLKVYKDAQNNF